MALDSEQKAAQQKQGPGTFADFKFKFANGSKLVCCSVLRSVLQCVAMFQAGGCAAAGI